MTFSGIDYDSNRFSYGMFFDWRRFNVDAIYKSHVCNVFMLDVVFVSSALRAVDSMACVAVLVSEKVNVHFGISLIIRYSLFHILFIRLALQFTRLFCVRLPCFFPPNSSIHVIDFNIQSLVSVKTQSVLHENNLWPEIHSNWIHKIGRAKQHTTLHNRVCHPTVESSSTTVATASSSSSWASSWFFFFSFSFFFFLIMCDGNSSTSITYLF